MMNKKERNILKSKVNKLKIIIGKIILISIGNILPNTEMRPIFGKLGKKIRGFAAKLICEHCGVNINIQKGAHFSELVQIGDNSGIGIGACLDGPVYIGKDVMMGPDCFIYTRNHSFKDITQPMDRQGFSEYNPVFIDDDVWIGGRVIILPGVHIQKGAILGAGTVVVKDVPAYGVVVGNPGKIVKYRT